ncbi:hypothetical protein AYI70_g9641, partial [Smittium culicis]
DHNLDLSLHSESLDLLVKAILSFPSVIPKLLSKASISYGSEIQNLILFKPVLYGDQNVLTKMELLCGLFVERNFSLYRSREAAQWIKAGIDLALERYYLAQSLVPNFDPNSTVTFETSDPYLSAGFEISMTYCTYNVSFNLCRHIIASDYKSLSSKLPPETTKLHSFDYDPLPPVDDINSIAEFLNSSNSSRISQRFEHSTIEEIMNDLENTHFEDGLMERVLRRILPWIRRENPDADLADFIDTINVSDSDPDLDIIEDADDLATTFQQDDAQNSNDRINGNQDTSIDHNDENIDTTNHNSPLNSQNPELLHNTGSNNTEVIWEMQRPHGETSNIQAESHGSRLIGLLRQSLNPLRHVANTILSRGSSSQQLDVYDQLHAEGLNSTNSNSNTLNSANSTTTTDTDSVNQNNEISDALDLDRNSDYSFSDDDAADI